LIYEKSSFEIQFRGDPRLRRHIRRLRSAPGVKQIFYKFVDSEPDLKLKADIVRSNGLILSSLADAAIISLLAIPIYIAFFIWKSNSYYLILACCSLGIFLVARLILLPLTLKKHITYSDEQIDSILAHNYSKLRTALLKLSRQK
jgi:pilus assembly protein TadC